MSKFELMSKEGVVIPYFLKDEYSEFLFNLSIDGSATFSSVFLSSQCSELSYLDFVLGLYSVLKGSPTTIVSELTVALTEVTTHIRFSITDINQTEAKSFTINASIRTEENVNSRLRLTIPTVYAGSTSAEIFRYPGMPLFVNTETLQALNDVRKNYDVELYRINGQLHER